MGLAKKPDSCRGCDAFNKGKGYVEPSGPVASNYIFINSGAGEDDVYQRQSGFEGSYSGQTLTRRLYTAGLQRRDVVVADLVRCWLPGTTAGGAYKGTRLPTQPEIRHCWQKHLGPFIESLPRVSSPRHIITMGLPALRWFKQLGPKGVAEVHYGTTVLHELPKVEDKE